MKRHGGADNISDLEHARSRLPPHLEGLKGFPTAAHGHLAMEPLPRQICAATIAAPVACDDCLDQQVVARQH